jgi:hypothetical protein
MKDKIAGLSEEEKQKLFSFVGTFRLFENPANKQKAMYRQIAQVLGRNLTRKNGK